MNFHKAEKISLQCLRIEGIVLQNIKIHPHVISTFCRNQSKKCGLVALFQLSWTGGVELSSIKKDPNPPIK